MSSEDAQGWVPATCLEAHDDPDDFTLPGEEGRIAFYKFNNPTKTQVLLLGAISSIFFFFSSVKNEEHERGLNCSFL